jgi:HK97 gp10 family phage protein
LAKAIQGIEEFLKQLNALDKKLRNKTIRTAMRDAMKILAADIKDRAPKDTGAMADSTKVRSGRKKKDTISIQVVVEGGHDGEPVPLHVEAGTVKMPARPFLRPAVAEHRDELRQMVLEKIRDAINSAGK